MRKIVLNVAVSLDGYIEGPGGEYDWCFADQDYGMKDFLRRIDALLLGRKTYELTLSMGGEPFPGTAKYVVSNTLTSVAAWATLVSGDALRRIEALKAAEGKDIWLFGGAELTRALLGAGLLDEMMLAVHPILLGGGKPLFGGGKGRVGLDLIGSRSYSTGLLQVTYGVK